MTSKMCIGCGLCRIIEKLEIWERTWACEWPSCICVTSYACVYALHMRTVYLFTYSDRPQRKVILKFRGWVLSCLEKKFQKCRSIEILSRYFFYFSRFLMFGFHEWMNYVIGKGFFRVFRIDSVLKSEWTNASWAPKEDHGDIFYKRMKKGMKLCQIMDVWIIKSKRNWI